MLCESKIAALEKLEEYKRSGVVIDYSIIQSEFKRENMKKGKMKWRLYVEMQAFIPRCCTKKCIGRMRIMFLTKEEAIRAWNRRADDGKAD